MIADGSPATFVGPRLPALPAPSRRPMHRRNVAALASTSPGGPPRKHPPPACLKIMADAFMATVERVVSFAAAVQDHHEAWAASLKMFLRWLACDPLSLMVSLMALAWSTLQQQDYIRFFKDGRAMMCYDANLLPLDVERRHMKWLEGLGWLSNSERRAALQKLPSSELEKLQASEPDFSDVDRCAGDWQSSKAKAQAKFVAVMAGLVIPALVSLFVRLQQGDTAPQVLQQDAVEFFTKTVAASGVITAALAGREEQLGKLTLLAKAWSTTLRKKPYSTSQELQATFEAKYQYSLPAILFPAKTHKLADESSLDHQDSLADIQEDRNDDDAPELGEDFKVVADQ